MLPNVRSREAFVDNVKMYYSSEQGQTIRQLLNAHMARTGIMCSFSSPLGIKQHLVVVHEKGKNIVIQLSTESSQKELTPIRLSYTPVQYAVLSLVSTPGNENFLAV